MKKVILIILAIIALGALAFLLFADRVPKTKIPADFILATPEFRSFNAKDKVESMHFIMNRARQSVVAIFLDKLVAGGWTIDSQAPSSQGAYMISSSRVQTNIKEQLIIYILQSEDGAPASNATGVTISYLSNTL